MIKNLKIKYIYNNTFYKIHYLCLANFVFFFNLIALNEIASGDYVDIDMDLRTRSLPSGSRTKPKQQPTAEDIEELYAKVIFYCYCY